MGVVGFMDEPRSSARRALVGMTAMLLAVSAAPAMAKKHGKRKKGLGAVVTKTATATGSTDGQVVSATATCPKGKQAFGGGYSFTPESKVTVYIFESVRSGKRTWRVSGTYDRFAVPPPFPAETLSVSVYCRSLAKPISDRSAAVTVPATAPFRASTSAACPTSAGKLLAGGFSLAPAPTGNLDYATVRSSLASGTGWAVTGAVDNSATARTLTAHAYCAKGLKAPAIVSAAASSPVGVKQTVSGSSPACPGKRRMSAGGFDIAGTMLVPTQTESRIVGPAWKASFQNFGIPTTFPITAQGICT